MNAEHKLSEIRQIAITVSDVSKALPFYRDVLGLTFLFSPAPTLAFMAAGSVRIMLSTPQGTGTVGHNSILYFTATDITATHAAIVERGAKNERAPQLAARMPDHELWTGFVRDPDGNLIGLMEEKRQSEVQPCRVSLHRGIWQPFRFCIPLSRQFRRAPAFICNFQRLVSVIRFRWRRTNARLELARAAGTHGQ